MKIYAPVKDANGVWASVRFINGVGETNNPALIEWFRKHGYRVEEVVEKSVETVEVSIEKSVEKVETVDEPDFESMTPMELREWAMKNGLGNKIRNTRNREKLLEIIRG